MEHLKASVRTLDDRKQGWKTPQDCAHCRNNLAFVLRFHGTLHNNRWRPGDLIRGVGKVTETCECGYQVFKSIIFPGVDLGGADNE
jgi:hypothetical protein